MLTMLQIFTGKKYVSGFFSIELDWRTDRQFRRICLLLPITWRSLSWDAVNIPSCVHCCTLFINRSFIGDSGRYFGRFYDPHDPRWQYERGHSATWGRARLTNSVRIWIWKGASYYLRVCCGYGASELLFLHSYDISSYMWSRLSLSRKHLRALEFFFHVLFLIWAYIDAGWRLYSRSLIKFTFGRPPSHLSFSLYISFVTTLMTWAMKKFLFPKMLNEGNLTGSIYQIHQLWDGFCTWMLYVRIWSDHVCGTPNKIDIFDLRYIVNGNIIYFSILAWS